MKWEAPWFSMGFFFFLKSPHSTFGFCPAVSIISKNLQFNPMSRLFDRCLPWFSSQNLQSLVALAGPADVGAIPAASGQVRAAANSDIRAQNCGTTVLKLKLVKTCIVGFFLLNCKSPLIALETNSHFARLSESCCGVLHSDIVTFNIDIFFKTSLGFINVLQKVEVTENLSSAAYQLR